MLADEQGIGKTKQAVIVAGETSNGKDTLVICPASMKITWEREIHEVYPGDEVEIVGTKNKSKPAWYVINYDLLKKHMPYIQKLNVGTVILDECHFIKGPSIRSRLSLGICKYADRVYLLTGTPIMNRPEELFNLLKALDHELATGTYAWITYIKRYCNAYQRMGRGRTFWDTRGSSNIPELKEKIATIFLRREKKDVLDLPPKLKSKIVIEMDRQWKARYERAWDDYMEFLRQNPPDNLNNIIEARHLVELQKLKQVCSKAKIDRIIEDTENMIDGGEKVIIFTQYTETLTRLYNGLKKYGVTGISGQTPSDQRMANVDKFQNDPACMVFIGNTKAAGIGITLTAASKVIFADMLWSPTEHWQAEDRAHRIGTKQTLNVYYYLAKDTVEEDIMDLLEAKAKLIEALTSGTQTKRSRGQGVARELITKQWQRIHG